MNQSGVTHISGVVEQIFERNIIIRDVNNELQKLYIPMEHMMNGIKEGVNIVVEMTRSGAKSVIVYPSATESSTSLNLIRRNTLAIVHSAYRQVA